MPRTTQGGVESVMGLEQVHPSIPKSQARQMRLYPLSARPIYGGLSHDVRIVR